MQRLVVQLNFGQFAGGQRVEIITHEGCLGNTERFIRMGLLELKSPWNPIIIEGEADPNHYLVKRVLRQGGQLTNDEFNYILKESGYPAAIVNDFPYES